MKTQLTFHRISKYFSTLIFALLISILPTSKAQAGAYGDTISHPCSSALGYGCGTPVSPYTDMPAIYSDMQSAINSIHNAYRESYGQSIPLTDHNINEVMRVVGAQSSDRPFVVNQLRGLASLDNDLANTLRILECTDAYGNPINSPSC